MCPNGVFTPVPQKRCDGLQDDTAATSATECQNNCCADNGCIVWQWADLATKGVSVKLLAPQKLRCIKYYLLSLASTPLSRIVALYNIRKQRENDVRRRQPAYRHLPALTAVCACRVVAGVVNVMTVHQANGAMIHIGMEGFVHIFLLPVPPLPPSHPDPSLRTSTTPSGQLWTCHTISSLMACTTKTPLDLESHTCPAPTPIIGMLV